jgi:hypothetical protein
LTPVDAVIAEWERGPDALRRLRRRLDARSALALERAERALADELVRRLGPTYDLATLAREYRDADAWARDVVARVTAPTRLPAALAPLLETAFLRASRGALDGR